MIIKGLPLFPVPMGGVTNSLTAAPFTNQSHDSEILTFCNKLRSDLAESRAELRALRQGGSLSAGGALPIHNDLCEDTQEVDNTAADEGKT